MKLSSITEFGTGHVLDDEPTGADAESGTTIELPSGSPTKNNVTLQDKILNAISQNATRLKLFDQRMDRLELALRKLR